ncbi:B-zip transcription factor [Cucumis melo var. makuwa]|uniref:B-zip transcription factor n=1 Tax=Cucumis melo var. makuwa TaxID=1194695 RepID=A0A5A7TA57_CUCMM|nr:B-zip transcription factor [Cucumis melo var. makuwa]
MNSKKKNSLAQIFFHFRGHGFCWHVKPSYSDKRIGLLRCSLQKLVDSLGEILPPAESPRRPPTSIRRNSTAAASIFPNVRSDAQPPLHLVATAAPLPVIHRCHSHGDSFWEDHHSRWSWFIHSIVGSVLAKEGRLPYVQDFVSGAFKIALRRISRDDSSTSKSKPHNDSLMAQVKSLREELQMLASNRQMTIVTTGGRGGRKYGVIILVVVVGYGIVWIKGWKLPDMMFATKRSLSDACTSVARQLENVYSSIAATKRNLSSKMDSVDKSLDETLDVTTDTQEQVSELRGRSETFGRDIKSVHHAVQTLENKLCTFEGKQDRTYEGVKKLCNYAIDLENRRTAERTQAIPSGPSRQVLELPPTPSPKQQNRSLPIGFSPEALSPSESNGSSDQAQVQRRSLQNTVSDPGLMSIAPTDSTAPSSSSLDTMSNGTSSSEATKSEAGNSGLSGLGFLTRTRSAMSAVFRHSRPSVQS